jgi:hypothetical protein
MQIQTCYATITIVYNIGGVVITKRNILRVAIDQDVWWQFSVRENQAFSISISFSILHAGALDQEKRSVCSGTRTDRFLIVQFPSPSPHHLEVFHIARVSSAWSWNTI